MAVGRVDSIGAAIGAPFSQSGRIPIDDVDGLRWPFDTAPMIRRSVEKRGPPSMFFDCAPRVQPCQRLVLASIGCNLSEEMARQIYEPECGESRARDSGLTNAPGRCSCVPRTLMSCKFPIRGDNKDGPRIARRIARQFLALLLFSPILASAQSDSQPDRLPAPGFHHLPLNSTNPDEAIDFYTKQFPSTTKAIVAGFPALKAGKVHVLFTKVNATPATEPQTAIWHFGWHLVDARKNLETYKQQNVQLLPLYTSDDGGTVSSVAIRGRGP